jgi:DNA-binding transcriptional MerR regulator
MALKRTLTAEEWNGLGEGLKEHYEEKDGSYVLSTEGDEDVGGLKSALEKERKARAESEKAAKQFQGLGMSPEEIKKLMEEMKKIKDADMSEAEKIKAENEALKAAKAAAEAEVLALKEGQLKSSLLAAAGLPAELEGRVKGTTEEEIKADIAEIKKYFKGSSTVGGPSNPGAPKDESAEERGKRFAAERKKKPVSEGIDPWKV